MDACKNSYIIVCYVASVFLLPGCAPSGDEDPFSGADAMDETFTSTPSSAETADHGAYRLVIGQNLGGEFVPLEDGDVVTLTTAGQGGWGVSVFARTWGLKLDSDVDVLLVTTLDGAVSGSYLNKGTRLYDQGDGTGMLWGVTVGLDPETYATTDDLLELDGERVRLVITALDDEGMAAAGQVDVEIDFAQ